MPASDGTEIKESRISGAGRGLFATKDFEPGDSVVTVDRPLVAEPEIERLRDTCAWCFQRGETDATERTQAASMGLPTGFIEVKACTGCRRVSYCSKTCQTKAWKRDHKHECKVIAPNDRPDLPEQVRAAVKLLGRLQADGGKDTKLKDLLSFPPFAGRGKDGLEDFGKEHHKLFENFSVLGFAAWKYAGEPQKPDVDFQTVAKAFVFNVMCNKFNLDSPFDNTQLGMAFDPLICSANHSCEPNVALVFNQPTVLLRALKPIKKGEEIYMAYCPKCKKGAVFPEDTFSKPAAELSSEYRNLADQLIKRHEHELSNFFVPANDETSQNRLAALQAKAFAVSGTPTKPKQPGLLEITETLKMCIDSGLWKWTRQPVPILCRQLFSTYIANGDPYRAFRVGCKLHFEIEPDLHPDTCYPDRVIDSWAMSTVTNVLCGQKNKEIYDEMMQNGVDLRIVYFGFLFYAYDNIPKMYGFDSPFGRVVESTYKQIMEGVTIREEEIRDKVKTLWPSLEVIARSVSAQSL